MTGGFKFDGKLSTNENLRLAGYTTRAILTRDGTVSQRAKEILNAAGDVVFTGDCFECNAWLKGDGR